MLTSAKGVSVQLSTAPTCSCQTAMPAVLARWLGPTLSGHELEKQFRLESDESGEKWGRVTTGTVHLGPKGLGAGAQFISKSCSRVHVVRVAAARFQGEMYDLTVC